MAGDVNSSKLKIQNGTVQTSNVVKILINPTWHTSKTLAADIALLKVSIQSRLTNIDYILNKTGFKFLKVANKKVKILMRLQG